MTEADEAALVAAVQQGDAAAYDVLVRRHLPRAYAVAHRVLRHREDAEDLVHDAFLRALDRIDQCTEGRPFAPWFFRLLMTQALNARRNRARRRTDDLPDELAEVRDGRPVTPDRVAEGEEVAREVHAAVADLPEPQRLAVTLVELEGFTSAEAAEILDMPAGTIRWHLHRARHTLRATLRAFAPSGEGPDVPESPHAS